MKKLTQAGDTIVEVLISVAILGAALGLGYGIATRSLNASRQAQERSEALKIAEGQFEQLRSFASKNWVAAAQSSYCFNLSSGNQSPTFTLAPNAQADQSANYAAYPATDCVRGLYHFSVSYAANGGADLFTARVRWDRSGGGVDELTLLYRIHQ